MTFEPRKGSGPARVYLTPLTKLTTAAWANDIVVEYFRTGRFRWRSFIPGRGITFQEPEGAPGLDWFGVNYYSRCFPWPAWATAKSLYWKMGSLASERLRQCSMQGGSELEVPAGVPSRGGHDGCPFPHVPRGALRSTMYPAEDVKTFYVSCTNHLHLLLLWQGIYQAVQYASQLGKPIYITETGIADAKDDRRATFVRGALDQVSDFIFSSRLPIEARK